MIILSIVIQQFFEIAPKVPAISLNFCSSEKIVLLLFSDIY